MFTKLPSNYTFSCVYFYVIVVDRVYHGHKTKKSDESKGHGDQINTSKSITNRHVSLYSFPSSTSIHLWILNLQLIALSFSRLSLSLNFLTSLLSICATCGRWGMDCGNCSCKDHYSLLSNILYSLFVQTLFFYLQHIALSFSCLCMSLTFQTSLLSICATCGRWGMDRGNCSCKDHYCLLSNIVYPLFVQKLFFYLHLFALSFSCLFLSLTFPNFSSFDFCNTWQVGNGLWQPFLQRSFHHFTIPPSHPFHP